MHFGALRKLFCFLHLCVPEEDYDLEERAEVGRRERRRLPASFVAGVSESARARARSASSVRSRRNGVIDAQLCSIAQRSVPLSAPSSGVTVNQKIMRPTGSLSATTLPS